MTVSFHTSYLLIALCVVCASIFTVYIYRHTVPRISRALRYVLIALRAAALSLILIVLFEPLLSLHSSEEQKPTLALLVDNSLSMSLSDKNGSRETYIKTALQSDGYTDLVRATDLHPYSFAGTVNMLLPDSFNANGGITNISMAIQQAQEQSPTRLHGIILISDGNYNTGQNPLYDAEKSPVPIFTVGVGDTVQQTDVLVSSIITNSVGYVGTSIPVDAVVQTTGLQPRRLPVSLMEDGKRIAQQNVSVGSLSGDVAEARVSFSYVPTSAGIKKLTVSVPSTEEEVTANNNSKSTAVKVLKSKINVVVVAGPPSADVSAVMQSLHNDPNVSAMLYTQQPDGELHAFDQSPPLSQSLSKADCLVLVGFPTAATPHPLLQQLLSSVRSKSISLFFISGRTIDLSKLSTLEPVLPFSITGKSTEEQSVLPVVLPRFKFNALLQPKTDPVNPFSWEKLPPLYTFLSTFQAKAQSQTLVTVKIHGIDISSPLVVSFHSAGMKAIGFLGYGLYRWKLLASSLGDTRDFFSEWFPSLIRWLSTKDNDPFFRIEPAQDFFTQGEPVDFTGQLYTENYEPVDNADLRIAVKNSRGERIADVPLQSLGNGRYEGATPGLPEGEYRYTGISLRQGDTVSTAQGRFSVGGQSIEFEETRMNKTLLQQIAKKSGGTYADIATFTSMVQSILHRSDMQPQKHIHTSEIELWNIPSFLGIIVLLLAVEWFLRKRNGML